MRRSLAGIVPVLLLMALPARAQAPAGPGAAPRRAGQGRVAVPAEEPRAEDVAGIDGMIKAFYEVISGPAGAPRQWGRDRSLYIPGVKFVSIHAGKDGKVDPRVMTHQEFVDASDAGLVKEGFFEREIHRTTWRFGSIVHVLSTYDMRKTADGPVTGRGVNSIELFNDGKRWWISAVQWDEERPGNTLPKDLLP